MSIVVCALCHREFDKKPSQIKRSFLHYCSSVCQHGARKTGIYTKCFECHKDIYKTKKAILHSKHHKFFCSIKCSNGWHGKQYSGEKHPNWTTGEFSYRNIYKTRDEDPKCLLCGVTDVRMLAVHHIDRDRRNNISKNLTWLCYNCHFLVHHYSIENEKLVSLLNS